MRILVVLVPGFSHLSLGAVVEPLNMASTFSEDIDIKIEMGSISDTLVLSAGGIGVACDLSLNMCLKALRGTAKPDALFLCCGLRTPYKSQADIQNLLRTAHRAGVPIFGTGCAAWKMADAGILRHGKGTVHWTTLPAFAERHQDIEARDALFVTSDKVTSTPGDAAALDMVIAFLRREFSTDLVQQVCNHLMITMPRSGESHQPKVRAERLATAPARLRQAVEIMEQQMENPMRVRDIAAEVGISLRQAERLFARYLDVSPKAYYLRLRLEHARMLIEQTSLSILEVSIATGFSSRRVFTRYYREAFEFPPAQTRRMP